MTERETGYADGFSVADHKSAVDWFIGEIRSEAGSLVMWADDLAATDLSEITIDLVEHLLADLETHMKVRWALEGLLDRLNEMGI